MTATFHVTQRVGNSDADRQIQARTCELLGFNFAAELRAGDEETFRWLHDAWNDRLVRYCFTLAGGNAAATAELVQATYMRLHRHIRVIPDERALWHWMARAARNAATDSRRIRSRYLAAVKRFTTWVICGGASVSDSLMVGDGESTIFAALDKAMDALIEEERSLIEMRYFTDRTLEEISEETGLSIRAVEGRLARLRAKLSVAIASELRQHHTEP